MKKLLDLLRESMEPVEEAKSEMVDEIGKFFVVEKPKSKSDTTADDIVFESTMTYFANQIRGGLDEKDIIGFYIKRGDANRAAKEAIKAYESNLKEMEDAMNEFRETKKALKDKKESAREKIKALQ